MAGRLSFLQWLVVNSSEENLSANSVLWCPSFSLWVGSLRTLKWMPGLPLDSSF